MTVLSRLRLGDRLLVGCAGADGTVTLADPATGRARHTLRTESGPVRALVPLKLTGTTCLGILSADGSLTAWAPEQGWGQTFTVHSGHATMAARLDEGLLAIGGENGVVEVRALGDARPRWTFSVGSGPVAALCALPGLLAATGADGRIRLRENKTARAVATDALRRTPDRVAPGAPRHAAPVPVDPTALLRTLDPAGGPVHALCSVAAGDRSLLAAAGDGGVVTLWDPGTGERHHQLTGHTGPVTAVGAAPDGLLVSAGADRTVRLWDPATGECRMTVPLHHEPTACVTAGGHLIVGTRAGTVAYELEL